MLITIMTTVTLKKKYTLMFAQSNARANEEIIDLNKANRGIGENTDVSNAGN